MNEVISTIPVCYRMNNPALFILQLLFICLIFSGMFHSWKIIISRLQIKYKSFFVESSIAIIAVPFIIFPIFFLLSLAGLFRQTLIAIQLILLFLAFYKGFVFKMLIDIKNKMKSFTFGEYAVLSFFVFFIYWSWIMPFPERFNGHFCTIINMIQNMWKSGFFTLMDKNWVNYDNQAFIWPPNAPFFLSTFSLPYFKFIDIRPLFLIPGVLLFFSWRVLRESVRILFNNDRIGDIAILLVVFSYNHLFNAIIYYDIFSPLIITLFMYFFILAYKRLDETSINYIILAVSFTYMARRQLFLLFMAIVSVTYLWNTIKTSRVLISFKIKKTLLILFLLPAIFWATFTFIKYKSPFYPHGGSFVDRFFPESVQKPFEPYTLDEPVVIEKSSTPKNTFLQNQLSKLKSIRKQRIPGSEVSFYVETFFPTHLNRGVFTFLKNAFCGVSVSLLTSLGLLGFLIISFFKKEQKENREVVCLFLVGYCIILYVFFLGYIRYTQYFAYIAAPFAGYFFFKILKKELLLRVFIMLLLSFGIFFWAFNEWGHMSKDKTFENIKFLNPNHKNVISRIAKKSSRSEDGIDTEIKEILLSKENNRRILYMDIEPGMLIPTILNLDNFANSLFYESSSAEKLYKARSFNELKNGINLYGITHIYRPGRAHGDFDNTLLLKMLKQIKNYEFLVPIEELSKIDAKTINKPIY